MSIRINGNNKTSFPMINKETHREIYIHTGITVRNKIGMTQRIGVIAITDSTVTASFKFYVPHTKQSVFIRAEGINLKDLIFLQGEKLVLPGRENINN